MSCPKIFLIVLFLFTYYHECFQNCWFHTPLGPMSGGFSKFGGNVGKKGLKKFKNKSVNSSEFLMHQTQFQFHASSCATAHHFQSIPSYGNAMLSTLCLRSMIDVDGESIVGWKSMLNISYLSVIFILLFSHVNIFHFWSFEEGKRDAYKLNYDGEGVFDYV